MKIWKFFIDPTMSMVFRKLCSLLVIVRKGKKRLMSVQWTEVFLTSHHPKYKAPPDSTHVCRIINSFSWLHVQKWLFLKNFQKVLLFFAEFYFLETCDLKFSNTIFISASMAASRGFVFFVYHKTSIAVNPMQRGENRPL